MSSDKVLPDFFSVFRYFDYGDGEYIMTLIEQSIVKIVSEIRNKKEWNLKIKNPEIKGKWKQELLTNFDEKDVQYALDECEYLAGKYTEGEKILEAVDGTFFADDYIPKSVLNQLIQAVEEFEKDTENSQDWHPGSDQQVLDLVHPSLYPVINGITRAITKDLSPTDTSIMESYMNLGAGSVDNLAFEAIKNNRKRTWYDSSVSEKFVWLPTEVDVNAERNTKILSYINNLHPKKYGKLYACIEQVLGHFVPMFNKVLTYSTEKYVSKQTPRIDPTTYYVEYFDEFVARIKKEINTEDKRQKDGEEVENEEEGEEEEYEYEEEYYWEIFREQKLVTPPAEYSFSPQNIIEPVDIVDLNGTRLQVIVKMANICLTPEKPTYKGGVWHIEGMLNEDIVSTGIYYYYQENITESRLNFRKTAREPYYEQNDKRGVRLEYGLEDEEALNQFLGGVDAEKYREELMAERKYLVNHQNEMTFERRFSLCEH
ncbi:hypothetical protein AX774_g2501 [Zancudomyces culisetae]|uniref:Uncharacterized protein n=1 Tax=Zancudomyces culisetae TaxID=1213189 RepID=A0A1R1PSL7_ZANCU|nr:hypothetical protein AX774_g2501 [Zancudomyces culisetae]|eukprot:OMH83985.1 hypothetical protein AX774_g2501 [Zancudomyces culisetae]